MLELDPSMRATLEGKGHRFASLWQITLTDGSALRFTDFSQNISYQGNTYAPMSVSEASARNAEVGLRERNLEFVGYVSSNEIAFDDLRAGKYNDAQVIEHLVDWRYPWQGAFLSNTYYITELTWTGEEWEAQLDGLTTKLRQPKGIVVGRQCRHLLGDTNCAVNIATHTETGAVTAVDAQRKQIQTDLTSFSAGYFNDGLLSWTSGNNDGLSLEVESYVNTNGVLVFTLPTDYDIAVSDAFSIYPGCNKTLDHCKGTSGTGNRPWASNVPNFGGFPAVPGTTVTLTTPNAK